MCLNRKDDALRYVAKADAIAKDLIAAAAKDKQVEIAWGNIYTTFYAPLNEAKTKLTAIGITQFDPIVPMAWDKPDFAKKPVLSLSDLEWMISRYAYADLTEAFAKGKITDQNMCARLLPIFLCRWSQWNPLRDGPGGRDTTVATEVELTRKFLEVLRGHPQAATLTEAAVKGYKNRCQLAKLDASEKTPLATLLRCHLDVVRLYEPCGYWLDEKKGDRQYHQLAQQELSVCFAKMLPPVYPQAAPWYLPFLENTWGFAMAEVASLPKSSRLDEKDAELRKLLAEKARLLATNTVASFEDKWVLGKRLWDRGQFAEAMPLFNSCLVDRVQWRKDRRLAGLAMFTNRFNIMTPQECWQAAESLSALGLEESGEWYQKAEKDLSVPVFTGGYLNYLWRMGRQNEAEQWLRGQVKDRAADGWYDVGQKCGGEVAAFCYKQAIEGGAKKPWLVDAYLKAGQALYSAGRNEEAMPLLQEVVFATPGAARANELLAIMRLGQKVDSRKYYEGWQATAWGHWKLSQKVVNYSPDWRLLSQGDYQAAFNHSPVPNIKELLLRIVDRVVFFEGPPATSGVPSQTMWVDTDNYSIFDVTPTNEYSHPLTVGRSGIPSEFPMSDLYRSSVILFRGIPSGEFMRPLVPGGPKGEQRVKMNNFAISVFEITQKQWELVMGYNPSKVRNELAPVANVTWEEVRGVQGPGGFPAKDSFLGRLNQRAGIIKFDLPTEAQWEYACRAGSALDLNNFSRIQPDASGRDANLDALAWYLGKTSAAVGGKLPNCWGLFDMHGNISEWCLDWEAPYQDTGLVINPIGPNAGIKRIVRGGNYASPAGDCAAWQRSGADPKSADGTRGFRIVSNF
jgi:tetratricopeptide (TPR) repeat protein